MKKKQTLFFGLVVLIALIGFAFTACDNGTTGGGGGGGGGGGANITLTFKVVEGKTGEVTVMCDPKMPDAFFNALGTDEIGPDLFLGYSAGNATPFDFTPDTIVYLDDASPDYGWNSGHTEYTYVCIPGVFVSAWTGKIKLKDYTPLDYSVFGVNKIIIGQPNTPVDFSF